MFDTRPSGFDQTNKMTRICRCAGRTETFIELPGHSPLLVIARGTSEQPVGRGIIMQRARLSACQLSRLCTKAATNPQSSRSSQA